MIDIEEGFFFKPNTTILSTHDLFSEYSLCVFLKEKHKKIDYDDSVEEWYQQLKIARKSSLLHEDFAA